MYIKIASRTMGIYFFLCCCCEFEKAPLHLFLQFDWLQYLQKIFQPVDIEINETEEIVVYAPAYLKNMVAIYHQTDERSVVFCTVVTSQTLSPCAITRTKGQSLGQRSPQSS